MVGNNGNGINDYSTKISRLAEGNPLRVVDLFAGCGGISLGFHRAGYQIVGGVELDQKAIKSFAKNFFKGDIEGKYAKSVDITQFEPEQFMHDFLGVDHPYNQVDLIVGGPPCQAFARIGRAKLRAIMKHEEAYLQDGRANLYINFLTYVEYFRPLAVLIENVPDILNYGGKNVAEEIASTLDELGYECRYAILNSALYGVPQFRLRFFLIAFLKDLGVKPEFPTPTHHADTPLGYRMQAGVALKKARRGQMEFLSQDRFVDAPTPDKEVTDAVTAQDAIGDLPQITHHLHLKKSHLGIVRSFSQFVPYRPDVQLSKYATEMRTWMGFAANGKGVCDHVIRYLPRDYEIFKRMDHDDEYPEAHKIAKGIFKEKLLEIEQESGIRLDPESPEYLKLEKKCVPPYDPDKFPNKWWKMNPLMPSRTLTAHMGKDTYSHIHYDSEQARVISVREAARLQSFPDGFQFEGPMNSAFHQIGNSVPPLMANALAKKIKSMLLGVATGSKVTYEAQDQEQNSSERQAG